MIAERLLEELEKLGGRVEIAKSGGEDAKLPSFTRLGG
jgi:hypothetical protein